MHYEGRDCDTVRGWWGMQGQQSLGEGCTGAESLEQAIPGA